MSRLRSLALVTAAACLSLACWTDSQVVWSPDGRRAAVIGADGLHVTDAEGSLSPLLAAGVSRAAWFADSQRLALVMRREVSDLPSLAAAIGPERTRTLVDAAEIVWQQVQAPLDPMDLADRIMLLTGLGHGLPFSNGSEHAVTAIAWYLRERYRDDMPQEFAEEVLAPITLNLLVVARLVDDRLEVGSALYADLGPFVDIRPAPSGSAVAFVTEAVVGARAGVLTTYVASADGNDTRTVAVPTAGHPDWSPNGRSLWYVEALDHAAPESDIGWLNEHEVLDADGHLNVAERASRRVSVRFSTEGRLRLLADGTVMFNARELHVPAVQSDGPTDYEQLLVFDPARSALTALVSKGQIDRLPRSLAAFEPGPDASHVLIGGDDGHVLLVSVPDGHIVDLATGFSERSKIPMPSWRQPGEFTYLRKSAFCIELVLRRGEIERVLSAGWPADVFMVKPTSPLDIGVSRPTAPEVDAPAGLRPTIESDM